MRPPAIARTLGTMVAYGFERGHVGVDLEIARRIGATVLEILPDWRAQPDPREVGKRAAESGMVVHSAHGCWGGQSIRAARVDLGRPEPVAWRAAVDDLRSCLDWLAAAGGRCLVVHPGGLSESDEFEARRDALARGLIELADHARGLGLVVCVENMPPGVHPGTRTADLAALLDELDRPELALALDTGHAHIASTTAAETTAAGPRLRTTHVHDNNGRQDTHDPPGLGTLDWASWIEALDSIGYEGPIVLECIRHLRERPASIDEAFLARLRWMTGT